MFADLLHTFFLGYAGGFVVVLVAAFLRGGRGGV